MSNATHIYTPTPVIKPEDFNDDTIRYLAKDSFPLWCLSGGFNIDGSPFEFSNFKYLLPLYADTSTEICLAKSAQAGATAYQMLRLIHHAITYPGSKSALYLPNESLAQTVVKDRLVPIIQSCQSTASMYDTNSSLSLIQFNNKSSLYTFSVAGKSSKDSLPISGLIAVDELRLIPDDALPSIRERQSAQMIKRLIAMSTVGMPGQNIDRLYNTGTQHVWQVRCGCVDGCDLPRSWPDCVVQDSKKEMHYQCPKCRWTIKDTQNGKYIPHNPGADYNSYHVSQINSRFMSLKEIWKSYTTTTNLQEFWNSKMGIPYVNEDARGITLDQLSACVNTDLKWHSGPSDTGSGCAMGVDQGAGYVMIVIADLDKSNKKRIRHVEIVENTNPDYLVDGERVSPFERMYKLMKEYDIRLAVVDGQPNFNDALKFAQAFPSKVFLAYYQRDAKDTVSWSDRKRAKEVIRKAGSLLKFRYNVVLARYLSLDTMLGAWADGNIVCPDPRGLVQMAREEVSPHALVPVEPCSRLFDHLTRLIRNTKIINEETGESKTEWIYHKGDPHLAHAMNYCHAALHRLTRRASFDFL